MDTNLVSIRFFDRDINFIGEVDNYTSLFYISKWETFGEFEFHIKEFNKQLLYKGNLIMLNKESSRVGIIEHIEVNQEDIKVKGFSLGYLLTQRITIPPENHAYHEFNTNVEDIMIALVKINAAEPLDINRKIPNLILEESKSRGPKLEFQTRYKNLADEVAKLSKASGLGWSVFLDYKSKKLIFRVLESRDLSITQKTNPPQIFSVDYENIRKESYIESNIGYKNCGYVAGQGDGKNREIKILNSNLVGLDRRETFIDAKDVSEGGSLVDRAKVKLAETPQITNFECEVEPRDYGVTWSIGDIVTTVNKRWNLKMHNKVTEVKEIFEDGWYKVEPTFGTIIPTPSEKIKQITDTPLHEGIQGSKGDNGEKGPQGYSIQYKWNGSKLGVKREDESSYVYEDLKGEKGEQGPPGLSVTYTHTQMSPSFKWFIKHDLKKMPSVTIVDSAGSVVIGDIKYIDDNSLELDFTSEFAGCAYLN